MSRAETSDHKAAIVIGLSSDIGQALCYDWLDKGWRVAGTYRNSSPAVDQLRPKLDYLACVDLKDSERIDKACEALTRETKPWDVLVMAPGLQEPIGAFLDCDFEQWTRSITVNFTNQLRFVHRLLRHKNTTNSNVDPVVIFFAGGGVNSAPINYSAYTVAKIALVKMTELLAAEVSNVKFVIIGPGWVKTKIHESILKNPIGAGDSFFKTVEKFETNDFTPMSRVVACCNRMVDGQTLAFSGRNFSVVSDQWDDAALERFLIGQPDMYKLRRAGNEH